jgi:hypothetical protein
MSAYAPIRATLSTPSMGRQSGSGSCIAIFRPKKCSQRCGEPILPSRILSALKRIGWRSWEQALLGLPWHAVREGVEVKLLPQEQGDAGDERSE